LSLTRHLQQMRAIAQMLTVRMHFATLLLLLRAQPYQALSQTPCLIQHHLQDRLIQQLHSAPEDRLHWLLLLPTKLAAGAAQRLLLLLLLLLQLLLCQVPTACSSSP
jgi:hypothetical protein